MTKHDGCFRGFHHLSQAWYADANLRGSDVIVDEISLGYYHPDGSCGMEMCIRWIRIGSQVYAKLEVFNDAWLVLAGFKDVIDGLAAWNDKSPAPERVAELLINCGFKDLTARESPYPKKPAGKPPLEYDRPCASQPRSD